MIVELPIDYRVYDGGHMKRTFTSHYKWGDSGRNKLIANMLAQGYSVKYRWEPQIVGEPLVIIWERDY